MPAGIARDCPTGARRGCGRRPVRRSAFENGLQGGRRTLAESGVAPALARVSSCDTVIPLAKAVTGRSRSFVEVNMNHLVGRLAVLALIGLLFLRSAVWAQSTAQIRGTVKDQTGAVVPGVEVTSRQMRLGPIYCLASQSVRIGWKRPRRAFAPTCKRGSCCASMTIK